MQASPTATATPSGADSSTVGLTAGVAGSGNTAGDSTGAVQVGGGNTATSSLGAAQSGGPTAVPALGLVAPPGAANVLQLLSVDSAPTGGSGTSSPGPGGTSAAGVASSPLPAPVATAASPSSPMRTQTANGRAPVRAQGTQTPRAAGVLGGTQALAGRVLAGTLPFTGRSLALWALAGLVLLASGAVLRRRGVTVR